MEISKCFLSKNDCYKKGEIIKPNGIVVHSTGANNPNLKRYVQPDDGILGTNTNRNDWNHSGLKVCVHAFIGKDKNGVVRCYQTLPWTTKPWGCGLGSKGSYNNSYIQFEICEDALNDSKYFNEAFGLAAELCAYLMKKYQISIDNVVSHEEAHERGYATPHIDPSNWLIKFGKDMNWFRELVKSKLNNTSVSSEGLMKITGKSVATATQMKNYIKSKNPKIDQKVLDMIPIYISEGNKENIRGDIAFAQSCLETGNFTFANSAVTFDQNNFCGLGVTSNGVKGNSFDTQTLGIRAQIQHLKAYANKQPLVEKCIDPRFKYVERGCAEYVEWLGIQENPNHKGWAAGSNYGAKILNILKSVMQISTDQQPTNVGSTNSNSNNILVKVDISNLNIRKGPGTNYAKIGKFTGKGTFTIVETRSGSGSKTGWGRLKSGLGWISLDFAKKI